VFNPIKALLNPLHLGFQQVMEIVEALIHRVAQVVNARGEGIPQIVDAMIQMRDTAALEKDP
jgi:hypothetical protein